MTNRLLHFLIAGMVCVIAHAQSRMIIDSLQEELSKGLSDVDKIHTYLNVAEEYSVSDSSMTVLYARKAIELSKAIKYMEGEVEGMIYEGLALTKVGSYEDASDLFEQVVESAKKNKYPRGESKGYIGLGALAKYQGNYKESMDLIKRSLSVSTKNKDEDLVAKAYLHLGNTYLYQGNYQQAMDHMSQSILINERLGKMKEVANGYNGMGSLHFYQGEYDSALHYYMSSLKISEKDSATYRIALILDNIGLVYLDKGEYGKALDYCFQSLTLSERYGYKEIIAGSNNNIGLIYSALGDHRKALDYHHKSLAIREILSDQQGRYGSFGNIGLSYKALGEVKCALDYLTRCMAIAEEINDRWGMASVYNYIGEAHLEMHETDKALRYFQMSQQIFEDIGASAEKILPLIGTGRAYLKKGRYVQAQSALKEALKLARESGRIDLIKNSAEELVDVERALGNHGKALDAYILFHQMEDSIANEASTKEIARLEVEYEYQQERDSIEFANAALRLILENDIQKRETNQRMFLILLASLAILLIILGFFYRLKLRTATTLESLNEEIKSQNLTLEVKRKELEYANKSKSRFFSIIAHDLRDPLNAISSFNKIINEHLKSKYDTSNDSRFSVLLWHFENSIDQISTLLNQLLTWAIKDEGLLQYDPKSVNLKEAFEENFEVFQPLAKTKNISLKYEVEDSLFAFVDKSSFMTILRNLTSNALKFTREGGNVKIEAKACEHKVLVTVEDSGIGIPKDRLHKIFDLEDSRISTDVSGKKGTGLGLMLVRDLVKMNKGTIQVSSKIDEGTLFTVSLPNQA